MFKAAEMSVDLLETRVPGHALASAAFAQILTAKNAETLVPILIALGTDFLLTKNTMEN